ncbi:MAG: hypothetical protein K9M03_04060 [Kiritimatiellales bacterium]|nr:hypothetical protein [Kiritimatiellales bacterium]
MATKVAADLFKVFEQLAWAPLACLPSGRRTIQPYSHPAINSSGNHLRTMKQ